MRIGLNPNKDVHINKSKYIHQIVIPVYIPNEEGYFKDGLKIFKLCLKSLFNSIHDKTFITIINNGSSQKVKLFVDNLYEEKKVHEVIHTENIGKINAIIKGLVGNDIELVTISDADVYFLSNWQKETIKIFNHVPKVGVVGIVPQFKMYEAYCGNVIFDNIFNDKLKFTPVKDPEGLKLFYDSIGWERDYNQDYLKYNLGIEINSSLTALIGSGHFVATYKKDMFKEVTSHIGYKLGGISEKYLDLAPLKKGYWRLSTECNFAYHMGNTWENWMETAIFNPNNNNNNNISSNFNKNKGVSALGYFFKNRLFVKFLSFPFLNKWFLKWKGLPKEMLNEY